MRGLRRELGWIAATAAAAALLALVAVGARPHWSASAAATSTTVSDCVDKNGNLGPCTSQPAQGSAPAPQTGGQAPRTGGNDPRAVNGAPAGGGGGEGVLGDPGGASWAPALTLAGAVVAVVAVICLGTTLRRRRL